MVSNEAVKDFFAKWRNDNMPQCELGSEWCEACKSHPKKIALALLDKFVGKKPTYVCDTAVPQLARVMHEEGFPEIVIKDLLYLGLIGSLGWEIVF